MNRSCCLKRWWWFDIALNVHLQLDSFPISHAKSYLWKFLPSISRFFFSGNESIFRAFFFTNLMCAKRKHEAFLSLFVFCLSALNIFLRCPASSRFYAHPYLDPKLDTFVFVVALQHHKKKRIYESNATIQCSHRKAPSSLLNDPTKENHYFHLWRYSVFPSLLLPI